MSSEWCNCQAISGSENYPGPWHPKGDQPHYPCASGADFLCLADGRIVPSSERAKVAWPDED